MFLRNAWYAAGRTTEIGRSLRPLKLLDDAIVLYRTEAGEPVALENACPHRKLPLSMGSLQGDRITCGYHGLTFDRTGACVAAPTQSTVPTAAKVRRYPAVDKWNMVWLWMGDPGFADPETIVSIDNFANPDWSLAGGGPMDCGCNYLYLTDNLLDPSHVAWVHRSSFAASGTENTPLDINATDTGVVVSRWMQNREIPPYYAPLVRFQGPCDRLQFYEVRYPSIAINKSIFTPAGTGGAPLHPAAFVMISYHFLTPLDDNATRYHWLQNFNVPSANETLRGQIARGAAAAFEEDRIILEAVHTGMAAKKTPNVDLALDVGALRFRRKLQQMIAAEAKTHQLAAK